MQSSVGVEKRIFNDDVPFSYLVATLQCLLDSYVEAHVSTKQRFKKAARKYIYPHTQRAMMENDWPSLAKQHGGQAATHKNAKGDTHVRCRFGRVVITQSAVAEAGDVPRQADFRETMAADKQITMLDDGPPTKGEFLYAILTHGPRRLDSALPLFIRIGFPSKDATYFVDSIDLTPLLREKISPPPEAPVPEEQVQEAPVEDLVVRLRDRLKIKKEGA